MNISSRSPSPSDSSDVKPDDRLVILAVDDESAILRTFERNFRSKFDVKVALGAEEALSMVADVHPDVLVSDFSMPGMNGIELLRKCAELFPDTIRVLATAHAHIAEVVQAHKSGVFTVLVEKPWTRSVMLDAITCALADAQTK